MPEAASTRPSSKTFARSDPRMDPGVRCPGHCDSPNPSGTSSYIGGIDGGMPIESGVGGRVRGPPLAKTVGSRTTWPVGPEGSVHATSTTDVRKRVQIGRASCREREEDAAVGVDTKKKDR